MAGILFIKTKLIPGYLSNTLLIKCFLLTVKLCHLYLWKNLGEKKKISFLIHFCGMSHAIVTMVMFQVLMMWMSLIRYCQDNMLFRSTNMVCHMFCSLCRFPSSLRKVRRKWVSRSICLLRRILRLAYGSSPSNGIHSVLVDRWNQEADGWHRRLIASVVQDPPLVRLRVVQQSALVASVDGDLQNDSKQTHGGQEIIPHYQTLSRSLGQKLEFWNRSLANREALMSTSICLKSQTAWIGSFPFIGLAGLRGFSWTMVLALRFRPSRWVLNSVSCSFSSCEKHRGVRWG